MRSIILILAATGLAVTLGCTNQNNQRELAQAPQRAPRTNLYPLTAPPPGSTQPLQGYAPTRISATPQYGPEVFRDTPDMAATTGYTVQPGSQMTPGYTTGYVTQPTGYVTQPTGYVAQPTGYVTQPTTFASNDPFANMVPAGSPGSGSFCPPTAAYCSVEEVTRYSNPVVPIQDPPIIVNNAPATTAGYTQPYGTTTAGYGATTSYTTRTTYTQPAGATSSYRQSTTSTSRRSPSLSANTAYTTSNANNTQFTSMPNVYNPYSAQPRMGRGEGTADWVIPLSALDRTRTGYTAPVTTTYAASTTTTTYAAPTTTTTYAAPMTYAPAPGAAPSYGTTTTYTAPGATYTPPYVAPAPAPTAGQPVYGTPAPAQPIYAPPLSMNSAAPVPVAYDSAVAGQTALNTGAREFKLIPALDIPPGNHPGDAGPSQWFEVVRPDNGPVRIGRLSATCVCVGLRIPKRQYDAGERILIEARMLSKPPRNNLTYGIFANIVEPVQTVIDADVTLRY